MQAAAQKEQYMVNLGELGAIESMLQGQGIGQINFQKATLEAIDNCCGGACFTDKSVYTKKHGTSYANDNIKMQNEIVHESVADPIRSSFEPENIEGKLVYSDNSTQESNKPSATTYSIEQQRQNSQNDTKATYVPVAAQQDKAIETQTYQKESKNQAYENKSAVYTANTQSETISTEKNSSPTQYQARDFAAKAESNTYSSTASNQSTQKYDSSATTEARSVQNGITVGFQLKQRDSQTLDLFLQKYTSQFSGFDLAQTSSVIEFASQKANNKYMDGAEQTTLLESKVDARMYALANSGQEQVLIQNNTREMSQIKESAFISSEKLELRIQKAVNDNYRPQMATTSQKNYQKSENQAENDYSNAKSQNSELRQDANTTITYNKDSQNIASSLTHSSSVGKDVQVLNDYAKNNRYENSHYSKNQNSELYSKNDHALKEAISTKIEDETILEKKVINAKESPAGKMQRVSIKKLLSKRRIKETRNRGNKDELVKKFKRIKSSRKKDARREGSGKISGKHLKR